MTFKPLLAAALLATTAIAAPAFAGTKMKTEMSATPTSNIVETAVSVDALSTLVAAVQAADLAGALSADGPFTVFAPTNDAFGALPAGTVDTLLKPENKGTLSNILTSHVVAGSYDAASIIALAKANDGKAKLTTLSGAELKAYVKDGKVYVKDENGGKATVATADVQTSNGVVHVVTSVLLPK
ncbi:fasciclin [Algimonas ampicilliniresistens]|uniref:Fasciclin n=1 Tax=Algimonas ampicilliniresistens TaxID=1298735 RepID=A0ABQ5VDM3_9PROT|nr:fasciclin domain-containing protein [Algimonas ampicilliniresistens]GLQ25037.1 fasciclin [Algimonas ampicilliniresistens]